MSEAASRSVVVALRPIATPLSLGFSALAVASLTMSALELRWIDPVSSSHTVGLTVLTFVAPLQLLGAVFGFLARDAVAATGLGTLSGTWLAVGSTMVVTAPGSTNSGLGVFLLGAATVLVVPAVAALSSKRVAAALMVLVTLRFYLTGAYEMTSATGWRVAAGVMGLVVAGFALYSSMAYEIEGAARRTVLPTGRVGAGLTALTGSITDEIAAVEHEPGVRLQL